VFNIYALLSIPLAYLLGSISSTSIIGRLSENYNPKKLNDGRISAASIYRNVGRFSYMLVVAMDIGFAASGVLIAKTLSDSPEIPIIAGFAAVAGHNWSAFLKFKGGLGATAIAGVLFALVPLQFLYGLIPAAVVFISTRRAGLSTITGMGATSGILFIQGAPAVLAIYPISLLMLMLIKRWQVDGLTSLAHWDK
jgi:acyl phosphate:glycerol-3-phosphate acyltransferase